MYELAEMLSYRRPAGSETEREFCERFIAPTGATEDEAGNWLLHVGAAPVLWSCHTDTVHRHGGRQQVHIGAHGMISLSRKGRRKSNCLGADCTAGVWIMLEMIKAKVPGLYVFHYGEERGGIGSSHIADNSPELLAGIDYAIAFDRRGYNSVVTHQGWMGGACCSAIFAQALADMLGFPYGPDDTGIFTDTANYTHLVSECTNLSVGYFNEHSAHERLDFAHLSDLRDAMLDIDVTSIGPRRVPEHDTISYFDAYEYGGYPGGHMPYGRAIDIGPESMSDEQVARIMKRFYSSLDGLSEDDVEMWVERNRDYANGCLAELGF